MFLFIPHYDKQSQRIYVFVHGLSSFCRLQVEATEKRNWGGGQVDFFVQDGVE